MGGKSSSKPSTPDYAAAAQAQGAADKATAQFEAGMNRPTEVTPYGTRGWSLRPGADPNNPQAGDWTVTTSLSPEQQQLFNQESANSLAYSQLAPGAIQRVGQAVSQPFDTSNVAASPTSNLTTDPNMFSAERRNVENALYNQLTQDYGQRFGEQDESLRTQLANQGLQAGTPAYDRALEEMRKTQNRAYGDARQQAVLMGGDEQSRSLANMISAIQAQQGQRQAGIQENAFLRSLPLNEANAIRSGSQVTLPQFQSYATNTNVPSTPIFQGTMADYNSRLAASNAANASQSSMMGGLFNLGSSAIGAFF